MFRLWAKAFKNSKVLNDIIISDIAVWLDKNINEFKRRDKTRFDQDNFIDSLEFDYLEIQVIEED